MTTNKTRWNNLPNEILLLIVSNCGRDYQKVKWMFVNKQWFNIYLSLTYNTISIDSATTDNKVDKILFSPFDVGKYVKNITFKSFHIASTMEELSKIEGLDIASDCLGMLMKRTPNVENVAFASDKTFDYIHWTYFSVIIMSNEYWRLHCLPELVGNKPALSAQYYLCAYHMRYYLKRLNLSVGMIGPRNYHCLTDFSAVETLNIRKGILADLYGLEMIVPHVTKLKALTVEFSSNHLESYQNEYAERETYTCPNLKKLALKNFTPKSNEEMLTLTKKLTHLKKIRIIGDKKLLWPVETVNPTITKNFFNALSLVPEYLIEVTGYSQVVHLYNKWSLIKEQSSREIHLSVKFMSEGVRLPSQPISLAIKDSKPNSATALQYTGLDHTRNFNRLVQIDDTVSQIKYTGSSKKDVNISTRLIILLGEEHINLKTLIIDTWTFSSPTFQNSLSPEKQHLERLELCDCVFYLPVLRLFLAQFNSLNFVSFDYCFFSSNILKEPINMCKTSIGTMRISNPIFLENASHRLYRTNKNCQKSVSAISVYLAAQNLTRFYIIIDDDAMEVAKTAYDQITGRFLGDITVIRIQVNSIKEILLKSANSSEYIKITFPKW
ncbi:hypothetical protein EDC94DRAFT_582818 [Helicostylum pulchrum]|nr:hypothetical protein EDC94DRAFT_582818 [Helicostylum pulchrum]